MQARDNRPKDWVAGYAERHVAYEFSMLRRLAFFRLPTESQAPTIRRAMIEAFALHLRAIIEFFSGPRGDTEVVAEDYCLQGSEWDHELTRTLASQRRWASQHILHLTSEREDDRDAGVTWDPVDAIGLLRPIINKFLDIVDNKRLHPSARKAMEHLIGPAGPEHPEEKFFAERSWTGATHGGPWQVT